MSLSYPFLPQLYELTSTNRNLCPDLPDYVQCCVGIPDGGLATGEVAPGLGDPGSGHEGYYEVSPVKGVGGFNWFGLLEGP